MGSDQNNAESFPVKEDVAPPATNDLKKEDVASPATNGQKKEDVASPATNGQKKEDVAAPAKNGHKKKGAAPESHPIENIVLLGRTGNGKSATGNSIARQKVFLAKAQASGVTTECQTFRAVTPEGPILNIIDTPGLFDMSVEAEVISREIVRCLTLAEGGIHAAVLVLSARTRFSKEEEMVLSTLQVLFGSKIVDYLIIIFSSGDVLEDDGVTLDEYLEDCPDYLARVLILCGQRMTLFDNRTKDPVKQTKQVHELLNLIDLVRKQNNYRPYTDEMYHKIKEENDRHKREQEALEAKGHSEEEIKALRKQLEITKEENFKAMTEMMEKQIKMAAEAQEKLSEIKEKAEHKIYAQRDRSQELRNREKKEMQEYLNKMNDQMRKNMSEMMRKEDAGCNIL
ncbi:unnamed protein product [Eruca vesicaria subsp. sativa]|uniref:AIG1-type G domain-containing protein n=1 Tax=Eruca vesicaria subsp. sativa TaxID=29727 RepID=A0ABC8J3A7_ERUVS|nr:unnamed protein product [Eruca vesicaria subsp. sativa]